MIVMMRAAATEIFGARAIELTDMRLPDALFIANDDTVALHTQYEAERGRIRIFSRRKSKTDDWTLRAEAKLFAYDGDIDARRLAAARGA